MRCDRCGQDKSDVMPRDQGDVYLGDGDCAYYHFRTCEDCAKQTGNFMHNAFIGFAEGWVNPPRRLEEVQETKEDP